MSPDPAARRRWAAAGLTLVVAVFVAFWPALGAGFQDGWDDNYIVLENRHIQGLGAEELGWMLTGFRLGHWHPLTWFSLALNHAVGGLDPFGYHLVNLLLHAANAILVLFLARAVFARAGSAAAGRVAPALAVALLFAVHPLRVESVVWITERRDVLSTLFLLGTLLAWLRWTRDGGRGPYLWALGLFALSLLSKAWGITLPAVLLILDLWPLGRLRDPGLRRLVTEKLPFLLLSAGAATLAFLAQRASGAMQYADHFGPLQKLAQACYGLCFYVAKSFAPTELLPAYLLDRGLDPGAAPYTWCFAAVALAGLLILALARRLPALACAFAVYAVVLGPVLGLTQSGVQLVADRYSYLATLPLTLLAGALLGRLNGSLARRVGAAAVGAIVIALTLASSAYSEEWHDSERLWRYAERVQPGHPLALTQLGVGLHAAGDLAGAADHYDRALATDPGFHLAYENRGRLRQTQGDLDGALEDWSRAIEIAGRCAPCRVNRGGVRYLRRDYFAALLDYERAVELDPGVAGAWHMLGKVYLALDRRAEAREAFGQALERMETGTRMHGEATRLLEGLETP